VNAATTAAEKAAILAHLDSQVRQLQSYAPTMPTGPLGHSTDAEIIEQWAADTDGESSLEFDADGIAHDEYVTTPAYFADWLSEQCADATSQYRAGNETIFQVMDMRDVPALLCLLVNGSGAQTLNAARQLRDLFVQHYTDDITTRAQELIDCEKRMVRAAEMAGSAE
jgi:hypothetical protein